LVVQGGQEIGGGRWLVVVVARYVSASWVNDCRYPRDRRYP
jgi:hypothetical protein